MSFQKQKISRDVQNMMPKIKTYRSIPKKKIYTSSSSLLIRSRKFSMTSRIKKSRLPKKIFEVEIFSRDCERTLTSDIGDSVMRGETRPPWSVDSRLRTHHISIFIHGGPYDSVRCEIYMDRPLSEEEQSESRAKSSEHAASAKHQLYPLTSG